MSRYHGPANVLCGGQAIPVEVDLYADHPANDLSRWWGTVQADRSADLDDSFWAVPGNRWGKLRLPDGRDGSFVAVEHAAGAFHMEINGRGTEPF
ncbi:hypothetical protein [Kitasatospora sp. MAP5-34]|uniref:hypothetical protein n=1 Tax=Kitasatospora sp. MAP5-34 TaxID=3035102 RepID=UPI0024768162|nr:hypothetical protein [Kitasatospora sp. MAP5-34]MDH6574516.1 hypothetical protein [Kitasatospora sp. MAP5-34]